MHTYHQLSNLIGIQASLFYGSDFTTVASLEKSEYFRGGLEIIADVIGADSKEWITKPLQEICAAASRCEPTDPLILQLVLEIGKRFSNYDNFSVALDLSTEHVPSSDPDFGDVRFESHEYGWIVWFTDDEDEGAEWLRPILKIARENGCGLIVFDRDASTFDGLETYEW